MIKYIPSDIQQMLLETPNCNKVTPLALAKAVDNKAFLAAVNPKA